MKAWNISLIVCNSGEMDVTIDSSIYQIKKGEAVLVFPHQLHALSSNESEHTLCIFSPELVKAYINKYASRVPKNSKFLLNQYLFETLQSIDEGCSSFEKKGFLYSLCAEFDKTTDYREKTKSQEHLLYKIFDFVELHYHDDCSLDILAEKIGYSYSYLSRYFKRMTDMSFNEYVNQYRISKACHILTNSSSSVLQCAYETGYNSLRSFNRNFKLYTNMTPNQYRK